MEADITDEERQTLTFGSDGHIQRPHLYFPIAFSNEPEYLYELALEINEDQGIRARVHKGISALVVPVSDIGEGLSAIQGLFMFLFGSGYFFDDSERAQG